MTKYCNQNCNQGRNCDCTHGNDNKFDKWLVIPFVVFVIMMSTLFGEMYKQENRTIRYDCSLSEISPDFPAEVKEKCRKRLTT